MKQILLNEIERRLLTAQGRLLQQAQDRVNRIAEAARDEWEGALASVVRARPMRERPPVKAQVAYDEAQGALVWKEEARHAPIADVDPPTEETSDTAEPVTAEA